MTAKRIDGKAAALALRERVAAQVARFARDDGPRARAGGRPGRRGPGERRLCPLQESRRRPKRGWTSFEHNLPDDDQRGRAAAAGRSTSTPTTRSTASSSSCRCRRQIDDAGDRRRSTRQRTSTASTRSMPGGSRSGCPARALHAARLPHLLKQELGDLSGPRRGRGRPLEHRRQADGAAAAAARTAPSPSLIRAPATCRRVVRRADIVVAAVGRPEMVRGDWIKPGATVIDVGINRIADRRRQRPAGRRCRFRRGSRGRRRDHAGARRRRADDHRLPDAQHVGRRAPPRRPCRSGGTMIAALLLASAPARRLPSMPSVAFAARCARRSASGPPSANGRTRTR